MSTSVEMAELLYDGGGAEDPADTEKRETWRAQRELELRTYTDVLMDALGDERMCEVFGDIVEALRRKGSPSATPYELAIQRCGKAIDILDRAIVAIVDAEEHDGKWRDE